MRILGRLLLGLGALVVLAALALAGLAWWSLPPHDLVARIPGLSAPVQVGLDADGIPRIQAANAVDGAAALGFMHARDRMFQMELTRRAASGRLSELAGASTLRLDRTMRVLGLRRRAEADLAGLQPATRALLDAYARGVNAWIEQRGRFSAPELIAFGAPEPWTPTDSLLWGKTMALYLSGNWRQELSRAALLSRLPAERVRALWPAQDRTLGPAAARTLDAVPGFPEPFTLPAQASNEWAVAGSLSATGAPLLAGDPHLGYSMPGIWYLARIETPDGVLAGATAPGVPFLIIGHNGRIAWTFTTTGADTQDVFIETPVGADQYATPDGPKPFLARDEVIHVLFGPDVLQRVRETRHGPLLSDVDAEAGPLLSVAMASLAPGDTAPDGLVALNRAATLAEARPAAGLISAPVQNLLIADRQSIGMFTTGRVPVRREGDGTVPVQGADGAHDWTGFATAEQLPWLLNPASGRIVNANDRTAPPDFPVFLGQDWFGDWRAQRIRSLLATRSTHTVQSFAQMQADVGSAFAAAVLPRLLKTEPTDAASRQALIQLRRWDGTMRTDWTQPLLFNAWVRAIQAALLTQDGVPPFAEGTVSDQVARALGPEEAAICGPGCGAMLSRTLAEAAAHDADEKWGDAHEAAFRHPLLGRLPLVGRLFTWRSPQGGDDTTVFRGSPVGPAWEAGHGPGFRGVFDLADLDRSLFALAPGQSGHPLSRNAASLLPSWRTGTSIRLGPLAKPTETIMLQP